jgi:hypothetical protein
VVGSQLNRLKQRTTQLRQDALTLDPALLTGLVRFGQHVGCEVAVPRLYWPQAKDQFAAPGIAP